VQKDIHSSVRAELIYLILLEKYMYIVCSLEALHWPSMEGPWLISACILFTYACVLLPSTIFRLWCIRPPSVVSILHFL